MKLSLVVAWALLSWPLYGQIPTIYFEPALPGGWTAVQQAQATGTGGYIERVTKVNGAAGDVQFYIQVATPSALEKPPSPFKAAAEAWKASAPKNAKRAGMEVSEEKSSILPHRTGESASFSFRASRGEKVLFMSAAFWIEDGLAVKASAISARDIREDKEVLAILSSIRLKGAK